MNFNIIPFTGHGIANEICYAYFFGPFDYPVFKGASLFGIRFIAKGVQNGKIHKHRNQGIHFGHWL